MQGHRVRASKDLYWKMRTNLLDRKDILFRKPKEGSSTEEYKAWADDLVNTLFSLASNMPKHFGDRKQGARDDIDELLAHYEHDLCEAAPYLDGDGVTRLAQTLYLLKSKAYENIWWRVENRVHDLAEIEGALDLYNVTNIIRSFSRSQENQMSGSDKLFYHLEPIVMKHIDAVDERDLAHLMYGYSVRAAGNPELYEAFEKRLDKLIDEGTAFDYPVLFNLIYYMLFRESVDEKKWIALLESAVTNEDILPIMYYRPFKLSRFYLEKKFPTWELRDYVDKFYYADRYYNASALDHYMLFDEEYLQFKGFLNQKCLVYPVVFMTLHNTFNLHYVFYDQKIAINYHLKSMTRPFSRQPSEMQKLP